MNDLAQLAQHSTAGAGYTLRLPGDIPYVVLDANSRLVSYGRYANFATNLDGWWRWVAHELQLHACVIWGPIAELARTAICGRLGEDTVAQATIDKAAAARVTLDALHHAGAGGETVELLMAAVRHHGFEVQPWWQQIKCDDTGRVLWDAPEYHVTWPLSPVNLAAIGPADACYVAGVVGLSPGNIAPPITPSSPVGRLQEYLAQIEADRAMAERKHQDGSGSLVSRRRDAYPGLDGRNHGRHSGCHAIRQAR